MRDRILFILFSTLLALACVLLGEWMVDIETRTHTDRWVYAIVAPLVALALSNKIQLNPFKGENFSHFFRFLLIAVVTVTLGCVGNFIVLMMVQPMGLVTGVLLAVTVFINQFFWVGSSYIPLLALLSCLAFKFKS